MKTVKIFLLALLLNSASALAAPASEATVRELLEVTQSRQMLESFRTRFSAQDLMKQITQGKQLDPKGQKALDNMARKMERELKVMLSWESMEPMYLRIYCNALTEEEAKGMLDFYKTPAGQALIKKMPQIMQLTMLEMGKMMQELGPRLQKELESELKAGN